MTSAWRRQVLVETGASMVLSYSGRHFIRPEHGSPYSRWVATFDVIFGYIEGEPGSWLICFAELMSFVSSYEQRLLFSH